MEKELNYLQLWNLACGPVPREWAASGGQDSLFQFGWEAEYTPEESANFWPLYQLEASLDTGNDLSFAEPKDSNALVSREEIADQIRAVISKMGHGNKGAVMRRHASANTANISHTIGAANTQSVSELPDTLFRDDTKNLELISKPTADLNQFFNELQQVKAVQVGSMQAMVSMPWEIFFSSKGFDPVDSAKENYGWFNFFNELDFLAKLHSGYERWATGLTKAPAKSFLHPYLGPINHIRQHKIRKYLWENAEGTLFEEEDLDWVAKREQSFKFIGSTTYRPDLLGKRRAALEVRDCHKDVDQLVNKVSRILFYFSRPRKLFYAFCRAPFFESEKLFEDQPDFVQQYLINKLSRPIPAHLQQVKNAKFSYEVYRNFMYPFKNWEYWFEVLCDSSIYQQVKISQQAYAQKLKDLAIEDAPAEQIQVALVQFVEQSGLYLFFLKHEKIFAEKLK